MTQSPKRHVPTGYRLLVDGQLDDHWAAWFGDLALTRESDGTTSLSGFIADQAALHGVLMKVRDLGVTLLAVEVIDPPDWRARTGQDEVPSPDPTAPRPT